MLTAETHVQTEDPGRYLKRLCQHASKMGSRLRHRPVTHSGGAPPEMPQTEWSGTNGRLVLDWGQCTLQAAPGTLTLRAEAADEDSLARIQDLVAGRLEKFGRREHLTVTWRRAQTSQGAPDRTAGYGAASQEGGSTGAQ
jgi:hypothetical protein